MQPGQMNTPAPSGPVTQPRNVMDMYNPEHFTGLAVLAENFFRSGLYKGKTKEQLFVILQMGKELGIPPTAAVTWIDVIQGQPVMGGKGLIALIQGRGHKVEILESSDVKAIVRITRADTGVAHTTTYTEQDAKAAGLLGKENYQKYKRTMILNRCISSNARYSCPDALGGLSYTPEDFGSTATPGGVVVVEDVAVPGARQIAGVLSVAEIKAAEASLPVNRDEVWESLFQAMDSILVEANTPEEKRQLKHAEWTGHYNNDRAKAIPGITKYTNIIKDALEKKRSKSVADAPSMGDAMLAHLLKSSVPKENCEAFIASLIEGWMEECEGDLGAVEAKKLDWLRAEGAEIPGGAA